jgi:tRNA threonylcarbamoyladenosine biosynthesis protein TsaB
MTILGIETSTAVCSVGLARCPSSKSDGQFNEYELLAERSLVESHIHSEKLLTLIQGLCDEQQMKLAQLDAVAVSIGPGSFTGLRIGLSTAKGLSYSLEKPLIAVPTFASIATSVIRLHPDCGRVVVCIDAKQREYYIGVYEQSKHTVFEVQPVHIGDLPSAVAAASLNTIFVTDQLDSVIMVSPPSVMVKEVFPFCRGNMIAALAGKRWTPGERTVWEQIEPMYLKDFVVRTQVKLEK